MQVLRTVAVWGGDKHVGILLGALLTVFIALVLYNEIKYLEIFERTTNEPSNPLLAAYISETPTCVISVSNGHTVTTYVFLMVFESG